MKILSVALLLVLSNGAAAEESVCFGTVSHGRLKDGVQLPTSGPNFLAYSDLGPALGRTYVHSQVRDIVLGAYTALEKAASGKVFVYGETGWAAGGRLRPHRTHQNGTSVDFFVPVLDRVGHSVPLPTGPLNKFGYGIEFDADARYGDLTIDFEAIGEHLFQLKAMAAARGVPISLVIFDPRFMPRLFRTAHGRYLKETVKFLQRDAWVRHDEHYHVDFGINCRALVTPNVRAAVP